MQWEDHDELVGGTPKRGVLQENTERGLISKQLLKLLLIVSYSISRLGLNHRLKLRHQLHDYELHLIL